MDSATLKRPQSSSSLAVTPVIPVNASHEPAGLRIHISSSNSPPTAPRKYPSGNDLGIWFQLATPLMSPRGEGSGLCPSPSLLTPSRREAAKIVQKWWRRVLLSGQTSRNIVVKFFESGVLPHKRPHLPFADFMSLLHEEGNDKLCKAFLDRTSNLANRSRVAKSPVTDLTATDLTSALLVLAYPEHTVGETATTTTPLEISELTNAAKAFTNAVSAFCRAIIGNVQMKPYLRVLLTTADRFRSLFLSSKKRQAQRIASSLVSAYVRAEKLWSTTASAPPELRLELVGYQRELRTKLLNVAGPFGMAALHTALSQNSKFENPTFVSAQEPLTPTSPFPSNPSPTHHHDRPEGSPPPPSPRQRLSLFQRAPEQRQVEAMDYQMFLSSFVGSGENVDPVSRQDWDQITAMRICSGTAVPAFNGDTQLPYPRSATITYGIDAAVSHQVPGIGGVSNMFLIHALLLDPCFRIPLPPFGAAACGGLAPGTPMLPKDTVRADALRNHWTHIFIEFDAVSSGRQTTAPLLTDYLSYLRSLIVSVTPDGDRHRFFQILDIQEIETRLSNKCFSWEDVRLLIRSLVHFLLHLSHPSSPDPAAKIAWAAMEKEIEEVAGGSVEDQRTVLAKGLFHVEDHVYIRRVSIVNQILAEVSAEVQGGAGLDFERRCLAEARLDETYTWFSASARLAVTEGKICPDTLVKGDLNSLHTLHALAVLNIVTSRRVVGDGKMPETLVLDTSELGALQHRFYLHVALVTTFAVLSPSLKEAPESNRQMAISSACSAISSPVINPKEADTLACILAAAVTSATGEMIPTDLLRTLVVALTDESPINCLMHQRVADLWASVLIGQISPAAAPSSSMANLKQQTYPSLKVILPDIFIFSKRLARLVTVNMAAHGGIYARLLLSPTESPTNSDLSHFLSSFSATALSDLRPLL